MVYDDRSVSWCIMIAVLEDDSDDQDYHVNAD